MIAPERRSKYYKEWYYKNHERQKRKLRIKYWENAEARRKESLKQYYKSRQHLKKFKLTVNVVKNFGFSKALSVYKKFGYKCSFCESEKHLHIHHKDGVGFTNYKQLNTPINNKLSNLVLLCNSCHMTLHKNNNERTRMITFKGNTMSMSQWANELGIRPGTLWQRIVEYNWPLEKALEKRDFRLS